jgi:hypothetical protein
MEGCEGGISGLTLTNSARNWEKLVDEISWVLYNEQMVSWPKQLRLTSLDQGCLLITRR